MSMLKKGMISLSIFLIFPYTINEAIIREYHNYLVIPKLNMKLEFYNFGDSLNDVNQNIEVLTGSIMPDKEGVLILAGHSGVGKIAYFNDLDQLEENDEIIIIYENKEYKYKVDLIYNEIKDGNIKVVKKKNHKYLYLTTCNKYFSNKQLVIRASFFY